MTTISVIQKRFISDIKSHRYLRQLSSEQACFLVSKDLDYAGNSEADADLPFSVLKSLDMLCDMQGNCANMLSHWEKHILSKKVETCMTILSGEITKIQIGS